MIQAPMQAYTPAQNAMPVAYQQQVQQNPVHYQQTPGVFYNYPTTSSYMPANNPAKSQFNGVNIEIINPQGQGIAPQQGACQMPAQFYPVQTPVMLPQYPQQYPTSQAIVQAPQIAQQPAAIQTPIAPAPAVQMPAAPQVVPAPVMYDANTQQTVPTAPAVQSTTAAAPAAPVVAQTVQPDATVTPESFAGRLRTNDLEAQKTAIEEIAETVRNNETAGPILLDTQIFDALIEVVNKDTSALQGPSPEVIELRRKPQEQLTEAERVQATTPSPLEKAEINKQYALYTIAYMQERLNNELEKRNSKALDMKDLPCIENVITTAKENPNPMIRIGALSALSHIARPEYKEDLATIFELAKADEDPGVKETAARAIELLNSK